MEGNKDEDEVENSAEPHLQKFKAWMEMSKWFFPSFFYSIYVVSIHSQVRTIHSKSYCTMEGNF
jgi:hypothetical protein